MKYNILSRGRERRSKPYLLLDIGLNRIRLFLIHAARDPIRLDMLREENLTPGSSVRLAEIVRNMLDVNTDTRELAMVMNSPAIRHQVIGIPPMHGAARAKVLRLEMKQLSPINEEPRAFSSWSAGKIKEAAVVREHVLCAEINQSIVDILIKVVQEKNFKLIGFTSYAQIASQLLKEIRPEQGQNMALVEAGGRECSITLFHSSAWNMDRHFLLEGSGPASPATELSDPDAEKMKLEVGRALQYFKQQVRNENINQIVLIGDTGCAADIRQLLESTFRIPVVPLLREGKRFAAGALPGNAGEGAPLFDIAHAAALHSDFEHYVNFLPPEFQLQKQTKGGRLALAGSAIALYALMAGGAYVVNLESSRLVTRASAPVRTPLADGSAVPNAGDLQAKRSFALATEQSNAWLRNKHYLLAELARELAAASPAQMRIMALDVKGKGDAWEVKLNAEIRSAHGTLSQKLFLQFQDQARDLPCLKQLKWEDVHLTDSESADSGLSLNSWLTFAMSGTLNPAALSFGTRY